MDQDAAVKLVLAIDAAESRARELGAFITMRSLNRAKTALGWEMQDQIELANKAARKLEA